MSYILSEAPESIYTDEDLTCTIKADGDVTGLVYSIKYMYRIGNNMAWQTIHTVSGLKETSYTWVPKTSAFGFLMPNTTSAHLRILVTTQNGQMVHQSSKTVLLFLSKNVSPTISNPIIRRTNSFNEKSISNITTHELNFDLNGLYGASQKIYITINDTLAYLRTIDAVVDNSSIPVSFDLGSFAVDTGVSDNNITKNIHIKVIDSRNRQCDYDIEPLEIYKYSLPSCSAIVKQDVDGNAVLSFTSSYQESVAGGANSLKQFFINCNEVSNSYTNLLDVTSPQMLNGYYSPTKIHNLCISIQDMVNPSPIVKYIQLLNQRLVMDIGADGKTVTFFGYSPASADKETLRIGEYASFGEEVRIGKEQSRNTVIDDDGLRVFDGLDTNKNGISIQECIAHIGYGDCNARNPAYDASDDPQGENIPEYTILSRPYYTFGTRNNKQNNNDPEAIYTGEYSVAMGENNKAEGVGSMAFGTDAYAYGEYSIAIGQAVNASGTNSLALGLNATASGAASIAAGNGVKTIGNDQIAVGRYNDPNRNHIFTVGIGLGEDSDNVKNRANGFYVDQSGIVGSYGDMRSGGSVRASENFIANSNNKGVFLRYTDNTLANSLLMNTSNELTLGYGQYTNGKATKLYGNDISLFVKSADASFRPYYRKGDSISMSYYGAGFINNNEKEIQFSISLNRPLIGSPTITVASVNGLVIRQGGRYLYGSGGGSYAKPSKYSCSVHGNMIVITATMANNTNVITKNDTIGVYASIKITFS